MRAITTTVALIEFMERSENVLMFNGDYLWTEMENADPAFDVEFAIEWPRKSYDGFASWETRLIDAVRKHIGLDVTHINLPDGTTVRTN